MRATRLRFGLQEAGLHTVASYHQSIFSVAKSTYQLCNEKKLLANLIRGISIMTNKYMHHLSSIYYRTKSKLICSLKVYLHEVTRSWWEAADKFWGMWGTGAFLVGNCCCVYPPVDKSYSPHCKDGSCHKEHNCHLATCGYINYCKEKWGFLSVYKLHCIILLNRLPRHNNEPYSIYYKMPSKLAAQTLPGSG